MAWQRGRVAEQDAGRLAGALRSGHDALERGEVVRVVELPGDPEAVRQVGRADEQDVDAVDRGDLLGVLDRAPRFDLDDPEQPPVDRLDVGVAELAETCAAGRQGQPAHAVGRVAHERDRLARLLGQVHPRDHDPVRTEVERAPDPQPLARGRADDRRGARAAHRVEVGQQLRFGRAAVLEVDDQPVEAGAGQDLGGDRRADHGERAVDGLAGLQPDVEIDDAGDGRRAGWSVMPE